MAGFLVIDTCPVLHNALAVIGALGLLEHLRDVDVDVFGHPKIDFESTDFFWVLYILYRI